jgi:hypothetical protein
MVFPELVEFRKDAVMNVYSVTGTYAQQSLNRTDSQIGMRRRGDNVPKAATQRKSDTVEISKEGLDKLSKVKNRVQSGFYNSEEVAEVISDKLSDSFDELG